MGNKSFNITLVGATGLVGREILSILEKKSIQISKLTLCATDKSAGEKIEFKNQQIVVQKLNKHLFSDSDIVFFTAGKEVSEQYVQIANSFGALVIDNSSAFRMKSDVPLIIPEVNSHAIPQERVIISNPNCSTIQMLVALKPLHDFAKLKRIVVSTYQAVSGAGKLAIDELFQQVRSILSLQEIKKDFFQTQIAFNVIPHIDFFHNNGYSNEEVKMQQETLKILEDNTIGVSTTTVRVPTFIGHGEAINAEFYKPISVAETISLLNKAEGVELLDDLQTNAYPTPIFCSGKDSVFIGRIRQDASVPYGLNMWVVADNLRKGAALNAIQIAEKWIEKQDV